MKIFYAASNAIEDVAGAEVLVWLLALSLVSGIIFGKIARLLKLPSVTGYLVGGIIIGPVLLGRFGIGFKSAEVVSRFQLIALIALGFMTFSIGSDFKIKAIKVLGKKAVIISVVQAVVTAAVVDVVLLAVHFAYPDFISASSAILLGAIAAVTAPTATLMVTRQYRAKGEVTDMSHLVVEISEMIGLLIFSISITAAKALDGGDAKLITVLVVPLLEILISVGIGVAAGGMLAIMSHLIKGEVVRYCIVLTIVIAISAACMSLNHKISIDGNGVEVSVLIASLIAGIAFCNTSRDAHEVMAHVEYWAVPLYVLFFVLSGAEMDFSVFTVEIVFVGIIYVAARAFAKLAGAYSGALLVRSSSNIRRHLGFTLFPQAAVALTMSAVIGSYGFGQAKVIAAITIFSVFVFELSGPVFTKLSLRKIGEIKAENENLDDDFSDD